MKKLLVLLLFVAVLAVNTTEASAAEFTGRQKKIVDTIYDVVSKEKNWETYGSLPSVCIAQAYVESGVGAAGRKNNLWGLNGGRATYGSLKKGIYAYMKCINKRWYTRYGATDTKSWKKQIRSILRGGYCVPASGYYNKVARVIKSYNLKKLDKKMFKEIKSAKKMRKGKAEAKKQREKEQREKEQRAKELEEKKQILADIPSVIADFMVSFHVGSVA
ncbi:MAG: glucosaminidase domain-containing protein [Eubacterium sp.]|nr:glucosaminidase domain-containing protein [Eubacterium sp.]